VRQSARRHLANVIKPFQVCFAAPADRWLALLFLLVGAHTSLIGSSFLFIARQRLALPEWGTAALLVQAVAAVLGIGWAQGLLRHASPLRIIMGVFALNLALALVVPALPRAQVAPLIGWAAATGATMAVDFTLLRVLLGQRLDREAARDGCAPAAAFYAGFHLPFNLGAMLAVALLFGGPDLGDGLAWWTAGLAALFSVLAMAGGMGMRRALVRECVEHLFSDARLMLIIN
jgi:Na+/melibiose symporter-like transporter